MQTPPPTPKRTPKRSLNTPESMGGNSPEDGSPSRVLFADITPTKKTRAGPSSEDDIPGTPPSESFSLRRLLSPVRGGLPDIPSGPPSAPSKLRQKKSGPEEEKSMALEDLMIFTIFWTDIDNLGAGSFGTVDAVVFQPPPGSHPGTPCSPPVALKTVFQSEKQSAKALRGEASNLGSPGCVSGVAATCDKGNLYLFTPIAIPLSAMIRIGATMLEKVISMTKEAIMNAPLSVVFDCKPDNLGFVLLGTPTVVADQNGQPCVGPPTDAESVVFLDLGNCHSPEEADGDYNPLVDDDELETIEQQTEFREFKCEMMEALLRNQFADMPEDEKKIVARICTEKRWRYAGGQEFQPNFQE